MFEQLTKDRGSTQPEDARAPRITTVVIVIGDAEIDNSPSLLPLFQRHLKTELPPLIAALVLPATSHAVVD
jgi:hypothetical protein